MNLRLSFRAKLLLAFLGILVPLLSVMLLVTEARMRLEIDRYIESAVRESRQAFAGIEELNRGRLTALGQRFALSSRTAALLQAALFEEPDPAFAASQLGYELELAGQDSALVTLTDLEGRALGGVLDGAMLDDASTAVPRALLQRVLESGDTVAFGYHLMGHRLYSVYLSLLRVVDEPMGFIVVGTPITNQTAATIGSLIKGGAELCFIANQECVASTPGLAAAKLTPGEMVAAAAQLAPQRTRRDGARWVLISDRRMSTDTSVSSVLALLIDSVVAPFQAIRIALFATGALMLLLAMLLSLALSRGLARPVRALVDATAHVRRGDYDVEVEARGTDELATLAHAFNDMTFGLRQKERYRGLLDKVVSAEVAEEMLRGEISLGGENREVTTLFADLRGFTALTEGMEPQEVIRTLNEVMQRASTVIEAEGGVVDKYVGDEVMGVFGAPLSRSDDALRAVRSALRIRDEVAALSRERVARGERALAIGVGVSTGLVVAGNMGSERRLNYTVLGESVNVAARLCTESGPQEILLAAPTYERVRDAVEVRPAGARLLRGLSVPVQTYALERLRTPAPAGGALGVLLLSCALTALGGAAPAAAQEPLFSFGNASGSVQGSLGTRVDLTGYFPQDRAPYLVEATRPLFAPRASLFADLFLGSKLYLSGELRTDRGEAPADRPLELRIEQLFARVTPLASGLVNLQAGKFVSPFGGYPQRHHSAADPFIRPPLSYDHRSMMTPGFVAGRNDGFIDWKDDPDFFRPLGVPVVWGAPYQVGAMLFGAAGRASWRLALMNSAPSSDPPEWDRIEDLWQRPSVVGHLSWALVPEIRLGVSYDRGPYMLDAHQGAPYPAGTTADDYEQELWGAELTFARGRVDARAEFFYDRWDVPNTLDGEGYDTSYYVEGRVKLLAGGFIAARYGAIHFEEMQRTDGTPDPWDYDIRRVQLGGGYRLSERLELRAEFLRNSSDSPLEARDDMLSLQLSFER